MADQESNLAILFVDVIDSLRTHEPVAGAATAPDLNDYLSLLQQIVSEGRGRVVKLGGLEGATAGGRGDCRALSYRAGQEFIFRAGTTAFRGELVRTPPPLSSQLKYENARGVRGSHLCASGGTCLAPRPARDAPA